MYKARNLLHRKSYMIVYSSLFLPYITHCCEVWGGGGNTYKNNIYEIYMPMKKAVQFVCDVNALMYCFWNCILRTYA